MSDLKQSATGALDIFGTLVSLNNQHAVVEKVKARVGLDIVAPFCKGVENSYEAADKCRDFSRDMKAVLKGIRDGRMKDFSEIMDEKRKEIEAGHDTVRQVQACFQIVSQEDQKMQEEIRVMAGQLDQDRNQLVRRASTLESDAEMYREVAKVSTGIVGTGLVSRVARSVTNSGGGMPWWAVAGVAAVAFVSAVESVESRTRSDEAKEEAQGCMKAIEQLADLNGKLIDFGNYVDKLFAWWHKQETVFKDLQNLVKAKKVADYKIERMIEDFSTAEMEFVEYQTELACVQKHRVYQQYIE